MDFATPTYLAFYLGMKANSVALTNIPHLFCCGILQTRWRGSFVCYYFK